MASAGSIPRAATYRFALLSQLHASIFMCHALRAEAMPAHACSEWPNALGGRTPRIASPGCGHHAGQIAASCTIEPHIRWLRSVKSGLELRVPLYALALTASGLPPAE